MAAKGKYPRINISITSELSKDLEEYREDINISNVCRAALKQRLESIKRAKSEVAENMDETIARLRKEKTQYLKEWYEKGFEDGYKCASTASYKELYEFITHLETNGNQWEFTDGYWPEWLDKKLMNSPDIENEYNKGIIDGVCKFWEDIKDKV